MESLQSSTTITPSLIAQCEIVELTTYITNLRLTDSWKTTTQQLFIHFKEKLCLWDSLVEESDEISKTCLASKDSFSWHT